MRRRGDNCGVVHWCAHLRSLVASRASIQPAGRCCGVAAGGGGLAAEPRAEGRRGNGERRREGAEVEEEPEGNG